MNSTEWTSGVYWTSISLCQSVQWKLRDPPAAAQPCSVKKDENVLILQCRLNVTLYSTRMVRNMNGKRTISNISRCYLYRPFWIPLCKGSRQFPRPLHPRWVICFSILKLPFGKIFGVLPTYSYKVCCGVRGLHQADSTIRICWDKRKKDMKGKYIFVWIDSKKIYRPRHITFYKDTCVLGGGLRGWAPSRDSLSHWPS